ncbi:5-methyltetrahydropteroyltriglutamate--homocysteine methyltransferase [Bifidobacterium animalis subsp. animalis MCC 0499]|uniref:5-methyltetrahydropteroyltriglutamate-- homocysteine S-methyltransferase n=1 Tax=Bifidobacterium animalis TaxID=28025 RepID=UPI00069B54B8|nr:5-methyltetrahydropteroyltriglutamate--homocysteine S-methyltransferase [Bifidobacterium animalis]KOA60433.1 5-methyltetrahydropteroyltriglutamate--homocysteine methyltransferase [Bifidobacterium animalis subsp. animalis MCC 0499]
MTIPTSISGFPRIGRDRELKKAIEAYWKGNATLDDVRETGRELRVRHWRLEKDAGIDLIPSNDFSLYDQMLDTAVLLNVIPARYRRLGFDNPEETLFAMARGYQGERGDVTALPMKKWFTTNYHYLVPEFDASTEVRLNGTKPFDEYLEAKSLGIETKPVLIGPYTFLKLSRDAEAQELTIDEGLVDAVAGVYAEVLRRFAKLGAQWVQLDEPYLVLDKHEGDVSLFKSLYSRLLPARGSGVKVLLNTYFGNIADIYETVKLFEFDGVGLDLIEGRDENLKAVEHHGVAARTTLFAGVVNGRNIWRNNYAESIALVEALQQVTANVAVASACSLLHVPFSTKGEEQLGDKVLRHFAFAVEKLEEVREIADLVQLDDDAKRQSTALAANQALFDGSRMVADEVVRARIAALADADYVRRPERGERQRLQREALGLPLLPTTTIGSFPQTKQVRAERARLRKGEISQEQYDEFIRRQIDDVVAKQEQIGLDVLVHGEFERNDMVEYFGQNLNGFLFTKNAWVQSYGTRCVKPPIIWGDVSRAQPITVAWSSYAQSRTAKPMKGMLTGPVTILNWSWPREDITHEEQTKQLALAIRDEVLDLEKAGIRIIQIDEAALREKLPLRESDWHREYLDWAIPAFRLVHSAVQPSTQIHTHMCYSEFNDIISDIDAMDADVISFEASRGDLVVLDAIHDAHFETEAGPGVYDIHSPRIPSVEEIEERIGEILAKMDVNKVWINPDCGLKTRGNDETWPSLTHMVQAAKAVRANLD